MDNRVLNTEELQILKDFIRSRGFKDELVQAEILDHFASKVEELLTKDPALSLQDAMQKAHQSFGALGFYLIQANLEKNTRSRYNKLYWQSIKNLFTSPAYLLLIVISWWAVYKGYAWAYANKYTHILGENDIAIAVWLLMIGSLCYLSFKFRSSNNYYTMVGRQVSWWFSPIITLMVITHPDTPRGFLIAPVIAATTTAVYLILLIAQYKLLEAASKDYEEFKKIAS